MYQQVTLLGYLGQDPELRHTPDGTPVASFNLAINRSWVDHAGQRQEKTTWFRVTAWRKLAENSAKYLKKGGQALVIGELDNPYVYTDRDGITKASLQVTAHEVRFLRPADTTTPPPYEGLNEDDIPF